MYTDIQAPSQPVLGRQMVAFVLGVAIGAAVATMYAPATGADTRARIVDSANQAKDTAEHCMDNAAAVATGVKHKAVSIVHDTLDRASGALQNASDFTDRVATKSRAAAV